MATTRVAFDIQRQTEIGGITIIALAEQQLPAKFTPRLRLWVMLNVPILLSMKRLLRDE